MASRIVLLLGLILLAGFTGIASDLIWATSAVAHTFDDARQSQASTMAALPAPTADAIVAQKQSRRRPQVPVCGNGLPETCLTDCKDEQCDDGNLIANDGCSPTCTVEPCASTCTVEPCAPCDGVCISTCVTTCPLTVTFTDINDAVPGKFFDAALSIPDAIDPNTLVLGLDTGLDPTVSKFRNFRASPLAFSYPEAADTISFVITAPCGYTVETVTFTENLVLESSRTSHSFGMTQLVVNGIATNVAITAPPQEKVISLTGLGATRVPMSITTSLVKGANESAELLSGLVTVQVVPVPVVP